MKLEIYDTIIVAQITKDTVPTSVLKVLKGREDFLDHTNGTDLIYGVSSIEDAIIEIEENADKHDEEEYEFLKALCREMGEEDYCYIQIF